MICARPRAVLQPLPGHLFIHMRRKNSFCIVTCAAPHCCCRYTHRHWGDTCNLGCSLGSYCLFWSDVPHLHASVTLHLERQVTGKSSVPTSAVKRSIGSTTGCTITEKAPTRALSWLKAPTSAFTFKTLLRHYAKRALTPW